MGFLDASPFASSLNGELGLRSKCVLLCRVSEHKLLDVFLRSYVDEGLKVDKEEDR